MSGIPVRRSAAKARAESDSAKRCRVRERCYADDAGRQSGRGALRGDWHRVAWKDSHSRLHGSGRSRQNHFGPQGRSSRAVAVREKTQIKAIRFQQGPARSGDASNFWKNKNHDWSRQRRYRTLSGYGKIRGVANYQTLLNDALREYIRGAHLETVVRQAFREAVKAVSGALTRTA